MQPRTNGIFFTFYIVINRIISCMTSRDLHAPHASLLRPRHCTHTQHAVVRASMEASAARDERARAAAEAPPPETARVQLRTTL